MRLLVMLALLTAASSKNEQCDTYRKKAELCHTDVEYEAGLSAAEDGLQTKHLFCCYTHTLLDCMDNAARATSCQLDVTEESTKELLFKYMRLRCDKYNGCNAGNGLSSLASVVLLTNILTFVINALWYS